MPIREIRVNRSLQRSNGSQSHPPRDFLSNGEGSRGSGAGGVEQVESVIASEDLKILHEFAGGRHGLGAHPRAARFQILGANFRHEFLKRLAEAALAQ